MKNFRQVVIPALCFLVATLPVKLYAQYSIGLNAELKKFAEKSPNTSWIYFKKELQIKPEDLFIQHAKAFGLSESDEMRLVSTSENPMTGYRYQKFEQYHNGVKVYDANIRVISENGIAIKATGHIIKNLPSDSIKFKSEAQAIQNAMDLMPARDFLWLDERQVEKYRKKKNDPTASLTPRAELIYSPIQATDTASQHFSLCWKVEVGMQRSDSKVIYLNAETGEVIKVRSLNHSCNGVTVATPMNGDQTIYTSVQGRCDPDDSYELWDNCEVDIDIEDDNFGSGDNDPLCSGSNTWSTQYERTGNGVQVLWGMRTTYDWFLNRYGWADYDGSGSSSIDCFINYEFGDNPYENGNNARYTGFENFEFGYGSDSDDPTDSYTALDIVAHEFTHGVNDYTIDADQGGESGALNESFSDIFGEAIEQMTVPLDSVHKWLCGQSKSNGEIRSMRSPHDHDQPDTYLTDFYWDNSSDPEVHTNDGVQNFFFYLLCEGGSGVNENGDHYNVSGIGLYEAIDIGWNVMRYEYISDADGYVTDRDAWIEAAKDMYGNCSAEEIAVGQAWYAVGVGKLGFDFAAISFDVTALFEDEIIQAIGDVYTSGDVDVNSNSIWEVKFLSGTSVTLNPGFEVVSGNDFIAAIEPCSFTIHDDPQRVAFGDESSDHNSENSLDEKSVAIFPNPFTEQFTLSITSSVETNHRQVKVYDVTGREIFNETLNNESGKNDLVISTHGWLPGIYLMKVFDGSNVLDIERLVKQ